MPSVKAKKKCCRDEPRCRTCPVVLKRLADAGLAERKSKRAYSIIGKIPKKILAVARAG